MQEVFATEKMIPALKAIWNDGFPQDSPEDISLFFSHAFNPKQCLVWMEDNKPVSMAFLLPAALKITNNNNSKHSYRMQYVYAAATLRAYRGRGIFGRLLTRAHELAHAEGIDALFLRPAQTSLFSYYKRFGYRPFFKVKTENMMRDEFLAVAADDNKMLISTTADISVGRDALLEDYPVWVRWPKFLVEYADISVRRNGGEIVTGNGGWALCQPMGDKLWISEWLSTPETEQVLRRAVDDRFHAAEIILRRPIYSDNNKTVGESFGMICPLSNTLRGELKQVKSAFPYMGLAFD